MTANAPRRVRRQCRAMGHTYKTDGLGRRYCARCGDPVPEKERERWFPRKDRA